MREQAREEVREQASATSGLDEDLLSAAVRELTFVLAEADVAPDAVRRLLVAGPAAQSPRTSAVITDLAGIRGSAIQLSPLSAVEAALVRPSPHVLPRKRRRLVIAIVCAGLLLGGIGGSVVWAHSDRGSTKNASTGTPATTASTSQRSTRPPVLIGEVPSAAPSAAPSDTGTTQIDIAPNSPVPPAPGTRADFLIDDRDAAAITPFDSAAGTNGAPILLGACKANVVLTNHAFTEAYAQCDNSIQPVDLASGKLGTPITLPNPVGDIALSPDGSTLYVLTNNISLTASQISFVDTATGQMTTPVSIQGDVSSALTMTPDGKHLYVTESGPHMTGSYGTCYVIAVDTASRTVVATIALPVEPAGVVSLPDSRYIYVPCPAAQDVVRIDTATNKEDQQIPTGTIPVKVVATPDNSTVYALASAVVTQIDVPTGNVVGEIDVDPDATAMAIPPGGSRVYLYGDSTSQTVTYFDTATGEVGAPIQVGEAPEDIEFTPDGKEAMVIVVGQNGGTPGTRVVGLRVPSDTSSFTVRILPGYAYFAGHGL